MNENELILAPRAPLLARGGFLNPATVGEAYKLAELALAAGVIQVEKGDTRDKVLARAIIQMNKAMEIGLTAAQGLESIKMINGKATLWGDVALALCKLSPTYGYVIESVDMEKKVARCEAYRKGEKEPVVEFFSMEDAKRAGLAEKGFYKTYPQVMLSRRARSFALRRAWPDVLAGILCTEELIGHAEVPGAEEHLMGAATRVTEDVKELLQRAIESTNTGPEVVKKWLEKAGVTSLAELPAPIADKILTHLMEKGRSQPRMEESTVKHEEVLNNEESSGLDGENCHGVSLGAGNEGNLSASSEAL